MLPFDWPILSPLPRSEERISMKCTAVSTNIPYCTFGRPRRQPSDLDLKLWLDSSEYIV